MKLKEINTKNVNIIIILANFYCICLDDYVFDNYTTFNKSLKFKYSTPNLQCLI